MRIAAEVKAQLKAKGKSTEGVETFEEFYGLLQSEAVMLQKKYQPALRDGIKIAVDLVNSVKEDAKDGDVDVSIAFDDQKKTVSIKPQLNTHTIEQPTRDYDSEIGKVVDFTVDSESHKIWIEERGSTVEVMMASVATPVGEKIEAWKDDIEALGEDDENYAKAKSMYSLVVQAYDKTSQTAIDLARKKAEVDASQSKTRALSGNKDNAKKGKITSEESERRKIVLEREYEEGLITAFEKVDYYVEQNEVTLKEAVKRLLLLIGDEGKVKVGDEEIERSEFTDEERKSISQYYDIAIVGVGSAAARWIHTNTKTYNKGIIIGKIGGWNDRGQETTSHPKTIVSPMTPTPEEQSKSGLIDKDGETIFERADDHVDDIKYLVKQSGFKHLEETSKSIRKKGEWSLINYGNNKQAIAARKIILATGAGPEHEAAREMENEEDTELKYKKVVTLNQFMNEVETLKPKPLAERKAILGQRKVLIFGGNAAWDAINTAEKLGFDVHPRSRRGFTQILPGTKNTAGKVLFDEQINNEEKKKEYIAGYYERHEISNGKVAVSFTGGEEITVDQFITSIGPNPEQVATENKEAGPVAILGGPSGIEKLLHPIYDLGQSYSDEVFSTVLGLESEDGLLEVIGAAAFRVGDFVEDTQEATIRYKELLKEEKALKNLPDTKETKQKLKNLRAMLLTFKRIRNKFNNTKVAHAQSVIVSEQLGALNSTIEAINRVNAIINDGTGETAKIVQEQIRQDGVNMQIDNWPSIQQYILINWEKFSNKKDMEEEQKEDLAKQAARKIIKSRGEPNRHPHGITWEDAMDIIKNIIF